ncbi:hypothetical protein SX4_2867 [Vibrio mimicus SX-4]|nr:hypothetical protein SX4_2867 [Vibrio mimicus SX-4]
MNNGHKNPLYCSKKSKEASKQMTTLDMRFLANHRQSHTLKCGKTSNTQ